MGGSKQGNVYWIPRIVFCRFWLQNEARKLNQQEVVEEDKKRKLPANWEAKKARLEWQLAEDQKKKVTSCWAVVTKTWCCNNVL